MSNLRRNVGTALCLYRRQFLQSAVTLATGAALTGCEDSVPPHRFTADDQASLARQRAQEQAKTWEEKHNAAVADWESKYQQLETQFQEYRIGHAVERAANELGFAHPQDALALVDFSGLTIDDDGKVTGFDEQLKQLAESGRLAMRNQIPQIGTPDRPNGRQTGGSAKKMARDDAYKQLGARFNF